MVDWQMFYDLDGKPISAAEWGEMRENNRRIAEDELDDFWISTVYVGMNMQYGDGPPLIYETMVFRRLENGEIDFSELYCDRYPTREAAEIGHEYAVREVKLGRIGGTDAE